MLTQHRIRVNNQIRISQIRVVGSDGSQLGVMTPQEGIKVLAYAYEEAFGEKVRALAERTRPRDLYDVINLYRNTDARPSPSVLLDVLKQKCAFKGISVPTLQTLNREPQLTELKTEWSNMLAHQLPVIPPFAAFWQESAEQDTDSALNTLENNLPTVFFAGIAGLLLLFRGRVWAMKIAHTLRVHQARGGTRMLGRHRVLLRTGGGRSPWLCLPGGGGAADSPSGAAAQ